MAAFNVQRSDDGGATFATLNASPVPALNSGGAQGNNYGCGHRRATRTGSIALRCCGWTGAAT
ncbi:MAG: hypothetical protein R2838_22825 [Caldilineaceae bacterium]